MANGWIKLHRCLTEKPIWECSTPEQRSVFITILLLANHKEKEWEWNGKKFKCQPGQFVTSSTNLAKKANVSRQNVRTSLAKFKNYEFLTYESTNTGILVTIINWDLYQAKENETTNEVTIDQPTPNQHLTTNKNIKNDKNDKKIKYADFVTMTKEEYQKLIEQFNERGTKDRIERLSLYKGSTGKKYASDYLTILSWERKNKDKSTHSSGLLPHERDLL